MDTSQVANPVFPAEIWPTVFSSLRNHHDLIHLWTDCRHVCTQFRDDVERVFITKHLTKTTITFDCGWSGLNPQKVNLAEAESGVWYNREAFGGRIDLRSISFDFDRLANEGQTAIFKIVDCAEEYMSEIMQRVTYCIAISTVERPGHLVCFRGVVNDTEVPDMAVDEESREISFDWRAMLSQFCAEEKLRDNYIRNYLSDEGIGRVKAQKVKDKMDRGEADMFETMKATLAIAARAFEKSRDSARRARIRRQWEADGQDCAFDSEFEEEEQAALGTLKNAQTFANFLEFSDDERKAETEEEHEDDENEMYEDGDDQDGDDGEDMEEESDEYEDEDDGDQDMDDDEAVEEESDEDADSKGGVGFGD